MNDGHDMPASLSISPCRSMFTFSFVDYRHWTSRTAQQLTSLVAACSTSLLTSGVLLTACIDAWDTSVAFCGRISSETGYIEEAPDRLTGRILINIFPAYQSVSNKSMRPKADLAA